MGGRGRPEVDPWGFLLPLAPLVWAAILTTLLLLPAGVLLASSISVFQIKGNKTTDIFFGYVRVVLQQDYRVPVDWWWKRLLLGLWMIMTVVLTRSYGGNLMSLLAVRHVLHPYQSLQQVIDDPAVTMVWEPNTVYVEFYRLAETGPLREVAEMDRAGLIKYHLTTDFPYVVDTLVRPGDHVLVAEDLTGKVRQAQDFSDTGRCDFYLSKEVFLPFMYCMIGQKKSPLVTVMSERIRAVTEAGLYHYWMTSAIPNSSSCVRPPTKITVQSSLSVTNLWGMFVVVGGGHAIGLLFLCLEVFTAQLLQSWKSQE